MSRCKLNIQVDLGSGAVDCLFRTTSAADPSWDLLYLTWSKGFKNAIKQLIQSSAEEPIRVLELIVNSYQRRLLRAGFGAKTRGRLAQPCLVPP